MEHCDACERVIGHPLLFPLCKECLAEMGIDRYTQTYLFGLIQPPEQDVGGQPEEEQDLS